MSISPEPPRREPARPAPARPAPARPAPPGLRRFRRFRRMLYGSIGVFSLLIVALVGANLTQGPRLKSAQINLNTSVERTGQRLLLHADEPLSPVDAAQVTVTPEAAITASATASSVDLQFADTLKYNTTYTVSVHDVRGVAAGATSTFTYSFTTPDPTVYVLQPGSGGSADTIVASPLSGGNTKTVYSAPHIRQFVAFPNALVVNTTGDDGADALTIVSLTGAADIPVQLAGAGTVSGLTSAPGSNLFGYTFTAADSPFFTVVPNQLYAYDLTRGQDYTIPVTGLDHEQLSTSEWAFVPGTTSLVARGPDGGVLLIDTIGEREGTSGAVSIDASDARAAPLDAAAAASTRAADDVAARAAVPDLTRFCVSPNARYLAAFGSSGAVSFVDIETGAVLRSTTGTGADWCGVRS